MSLINKSQSKLEKAQAESELTQRIASDLEKVGVREPDFLLIHPLWGSEADLIYKAETAREAFDLAVSFEPKIPILQVTEPGKAFKPETGMGANDHAGTAVEPVIIDMQEGGDYPSYDSGIHVKFFVQLSEGLFVRVTIKISSKHRNMDWPRVKVERKKVRGGTRVERTELFACGGMHSLKWASGGADIANNFTLYWPVSYPDSDWTHTKEWLSTLL